MRRFRHFTSESDTSSEINMSPLIDIVFILLIFFIVTTVFVDDPGVEINKPRAATASEMEKNSILLAVTSDGDVYHGGRNIGVDGVSSIVSSLLVEDPDLPVVIQGDKEAKHGVIMKVTDAAQIGGAKSIFSATAK
ncbi:outer membrane transport energization protein ExbD (TC 2.C.1.1.1) [Rubritalea squalenifaciens DSM 18772]|uniref:Outer membrane transport energization protein ExbD (TC 2.C.1.1.1) n=1 Tax=Rubritalea squalenifaciens DSM 18772 TaxID=1123071 RepID=A0A1M6IPZ4_9BACT|nr:biopolymer transporter ExbD [Rubritalea squalenifaciens]SHJ36531.1 outer membrane transport energization protein ExbD (TC 2.C.1.1.1) [Rubritalea squalenifaciens DSM 18772]